MEACKSPQKKPVWSLNCFNSGKECLDNGFMWVYPAACSVGGTDVNLVVDTSLAFVDV